MRARFLSSWRCRVNNDLTRIWRLPLPEDWEPDGVWCVSFQIPAGDDYAEALRAAVGLLTLPKTYERDITETGAATVANTWQQVLYAAPMQVEENCVVPPVLPIPDADAAGDAAAAVIRVFWQHIVSELNSCAPTSGDCDGCVDTIMTELAPYGASDAVRGALVRLCADLNAASSGDRADLEDDCAYTDVFGDLRQNIADNPYDWLNQLSDWMFGWLNTAASNLFADLDTLAGLMTGSGIGSFIADNGGITPGGGAGFEESCGWQRVINFVDGQQGWYIAVLGGQDYAVWAGNRFDSVIVGGNVQCYIKLDFASPFHLLGIDFTSSCVLQGSSSTSAGGAVYHDGAQTGAEYIVTPFSGEKTLHFDIEDPATGQIGCIIGRGTDYQTGDFTNIYSVTVRGSGPVPPELGA